MSNEAKMELTKREQQGYVTLTGRLLWADLVEPGGAPGFTPKYSATLQVEKGSESVVRLFAVMRDVAVKTWGKGSAFERLQAIQEQIERGTSLKNADCSILDGDVVEPEYNAGYYLVKAGRRMQQGRPILLSREGFPIFQGDGKPSRPLEEAPKAGDGVLLVVNVWAQKKHQRINFTVEAVRRAVEGSASVTAGTSPEQAQALSEDLSALPLPASISGVVQETPQLADVAAAEEPVHNKAILVTDAGAQRAEEAPRSPARQSLFR